MTLTVRHPVDDDRWRLLDWRNDERVRSVSLNDEIIDRETHSAWFDRMSTSRSDEFLVVAWDGEPAGLVQLESLDPVARTSSWGCHLGRIDVPPGVGASLPVLGLGLGFERHRLRRMHAQVLASNKNMRSIHRRLAIPIERQRREHSRRHDGTLDDLYEYGVLMSEWPAIREAAARLLPSQVRAGVEACLSVLGQPIEPHR